jgi:type IV pilus biogenesis/stability protein PilW
MDFRFLQTFYPTRGILVFYDRTTGKIVPLPGADDLEYVHCNAVWTPDGRELIFLRAKATDSILRGPRPVKANDPSEIQIKYDLCTIPFNDGRGGKARPIPGASNNGKSNSFPKISPDGRWLVWVQAANGLLMRPDSELYIMSLSGGEPRRMSCNLSLMNSWHSFSPNSRWMVFSSKANTPYTQMFLTHIDDQGNDSPAILIPNSTPSNRAVNLPEFVNIRPDDLVSIDAPAVDFRRHLDRGLELIRTGDLAGAFKELKTVEEMKPDIPEALAALGYCYREMGDVDRAVSYFQKTLALDPRNWSARNLYGIILFQQGKYEEALSQFQAAIEIYPINSLSLANSLTNIGAVHFTRGDPEKAREYFEKAIEANPQYAKAHFNLGLVKVRQGKFAEAVGHYEKCLEITPDNASALEKLAWLYATCPDEGVRNGRRAVELAQKLERLTSKPVPQIYDILAAALAESGQFAQAVETAEKALQLTGSDDPSAGRRRRLVDLYKSGKAYHEQAR